MTDQRDDDLLEQLWRANPVPADVTAGRRRTADADALFADIVQTPPGARRRSRRVVLIAVAIAIALLLLAALGAFFLRHEKTPKQPASAVCYPAANLRAGPIVIVGVNGDDPRPACAEQWRLRKLGPGPPPNFAVCVLPTGVQAVFPGESGTTCQQLGLEVAGPGRRAEAEMSSELGRRIFEQCFDEPGARALVHEVLAKHGLADWEVSVGRDRPFGRKYPCADVAIHIPARKVVIVAIPDPFGPAPAG